MGGEKWCFSQLCLQTPSIPDPYGAWWSCPTADDMCCLGFSVAGFPPRGACEVSRALFFASHGPTDHPDHRGQNVLTVPPTLPLPYGSFQVNRCAQSCWPEGWDPLAGRANLLLRSTDFLPHGWIAPTSHPHHCLKSFGTGYAVGWWRC